MTAEGKLKRENLGYETHTEGDGNRRRKQTNRDKKLELGRIAWISRSNKRDRIQLRFNLPRSRFIFVQMRTINATPTSIHDTNRPINKQQGAVYSFFTLLFFGFPHSLFSSVRTIVRNKHPTLVPGWNALDNWTRLNLIRAHSFFFFFRFSIIAIMHVQQLFTLFQQQFLSPLLSLSFSLFFSLSHRIV